ncbi:hypothetical protein FACS189429_4610 [Bacteroidia bacterium]|nr:hypothetical protein FACS189429_4610 [Bacteroidia bacterium]GHV44551.1 hypothetical protein FACS1894180_6030 [Bacteroidia bacterium]
MDYKKEIDFLNKVEKTDGQNDRIKLTDEEINNIKNEHKNIPDDYLKYLQNIGFGSFRESQFMIYKNLKTLFDIGIETENDEYNKLIFFGDNFSGDLSGFDLSGNVVEYWHDSDEIYETDKSFKEYIREQMLMDNNGNDLRKG